MKPYELFSNSQLEDLPQTTNKKAPSLITVAPLFLGLLIGSTDTAGSGGVMTAHSLENLRYQIHEPRIHIEPSLNINNIDKRSPAEHVAFIRETLALNMSDLATVLNVTRPTIYAWLEGQEPKSEMLGQIQQVSQVADKLRLLNIPRIDVLVRRPIFDGRSLLDKLKAGEDTSNYFSTLKNLANKEEQARNTPKGASKNKQPLTDFVNEYSTPLYNKS